MTGENDCEMCDAGSAIDRVRQVDWGPGEGILRLCRTCREAHVGEFRELG